MTYNSSKTGAQVDSVVDAGLSGGSTLYGVSNLLGTVNQSGGVPTGAVIERGTGNGGEYVRFADGTQIATGTIGTSTLAAAGSYPGGFAGFIQGVAWAAAFAEVPLISYYAQRTGGPTGAALGVGTTETTPTSTVSQNVFPYANAAIDVIVKYIAIGRWF